MGSSAVRLGSDPEVTKAVLADNADFERKGTTL